MKLAELCDSSTGYIGQIEIGNKFPSVEMIEKISSALSIKPYMLFMDESDQDSSVEAMSSIKNNQYPDSESGSDELVIKLTTAIRRVVKKYYSGSS